MTIDLLFKCVGLGACALMLNGCSHLAPIWPEGGEPQPLPKYSDVTAAECSNDGGSDQQALKCARLRINETFEEYSSSRQNIERFRNASALALFGAGAAAGVNVLTKGSKKGLQTLGIAAAGLVGLDKTLEIDEQHKTFGAGVDALQCVMRNDLGLHQTKALLTGYGRRLSQFSDALTDQFGTASALFALRKAAYTSTGSALSSLAATNVSGTMLIHEANAQQLRTLQAVEDVVNAARTLGRILAEKGDLDRAQELTYSLNEIKREVSNRLLYSHAELDAIYAAMKKAIQESNKQAVSVVQGAQAANDKVKADGGATLARLREVNKRSEDELRITALAVSLEVYSGVLDGAQATLVDPYQECVALAKAPATPRT